MPDAPMWRRYLRFFGPNAKADVEDELRFHLEAKMRELEEAGLPAAQARARCLQEFGSVDPVVAACRQIAEEKMISQRRRASFAGWGQDMRYAAKQLRRGLGSTALAFLTLALGLGSTTAVFSIVYSVVLKPLPFKDADQLVTVWSTREGVDDEVIPRNFDSWRRESTSFQSIAAAEPTTFTITDGGNPMQSAGATVSFDFFRVFGVAPQSGRTFTREEDRPGSARVVVLSDRLWRSRFQADRTIIGRQIHLNMAPYTVIGIMPAAFDIEGHGEDLWTPLALSGQEMNWAGGVLKVTGRLKQSVALRTAQAEMGVLARQLEIRYPEVNRHRGIRLRLLSAELAGDVGQKLFLLLAATGFVLLIGCANVANLLLARSAVRRKEFSVRLAIGSSGGRLIRQLLTESLLLALASALLGMIIAEVAIHVIIAMAHGAAPRLADAKLDPVTLIFAFTLTCLSSLVFGVFPAWQASRTYVQAGLSQGGRSADAPVRLKIRSLLIAGQVAFSFGLLITAGLFIYHAVVAERTKPGFHAQSILTAHTALPTAQYSSAEAVRNGYRRIITQLENLPPVSSVALTSKVPLTAGTMGMLLKQNAMPSLGSREIAAELRYITPNYFAVLGIPLQQGRAFDLRDESDTPHVVIANETLARQLQTGRATVGQTLQLPELEGNPAWQIVGVAGDTRDNGALADAPPVLYVPVTQVSKHAWNWTQQALYVVARTKANPALFVRALEDAVHRVDPNLPVSDSEALENRVERSLSTARLYSRLLMVLGCCGLLLTAGGIYGVVAYVVGQQAGELGIRLALGASGWRVMTGVIRQGMRPVVVGIVIGCVGSFAAGRSFGLGANAEFCGVGLLTAALVLGAASLACYVPARRASRIDPARAIATSH